MGTRAARKNRFRHYSGGRKPRACDASGRGRALHAGNSSSPETAARPGSNRRQSRRPGRRRSRGARRLSPGRNCNRVHPELSMPRRRALRRQSALLARLAGFRDGRNRGRRCLRCRSAANLDLHPGRDRQHRSAQPRQLRSRRATRPHDGPRRTRRAPQRIFAGRHPNRFTPNRTESRAERSKRRTRSRPRLRRADSDLSGQPSRRRRLPVEAPAQSLEALTALEAIEEQNRRDRRIDLERRRLATAMTLVTIGGLAVVGIPGELFVELGLALKANPHFARTFVAGYCNDLIGYIPTRAAYAEGGYEVDTARIAAGSGETIVDTALTALAAMRA